MEKRHICYFAVIFFVCISLFRVQIFAGEYGGNEGEQSRVYLEELKQQMDFSGLDETLAKDLAVYTDRYREKMTFSGMVDGLLENGIAGFDASLIKDWIIDILFYEIDKNRKFLLEVVLIALAFSVLKNFAGTFRLSYISQLCFMLVYCVLGVMLLESFLNFTSIAEEALTGSIDFMKALIPTVSLTLVFSSGVSSSAGFYQIAFVVIYLIQWVFLKFLMPGIRLYVILELFNHFFEETMFSNLAELLRDIICWVMKIASAVVLGLNVVQGLLAPAKDKVLYGSMGKAASMIPGIGNTVNGLSEILLASGVFIKNCVGVAALIFLVALGLVPMIKMAVLAVFYKFAAAVTEPVTDKRILGCLKGMSEGGMLYLKLTGYSMVLFLLTIALTTAVSA